MVKTKVSMLWQVPYNVCKQDILRHVGSAPRMQRNILFFSCALGTAGGVLCGILASFS